MEHFSPKRLLTLTLVLATVYSSEAGETQQEDEPNPLIQVATELLQAQLQGQGGGGAGGGQGLGGILQTLMQSDGGRHIGDMLMGAAKGNNGGQAADIVSALGSMFASQGKNNEGGFDPQLIGQMVSMFASQASGDEDNNNVDINNNEIKKGKSHKKASSNDLGIDWESMLSLAGNFMAAQKGGGGGWEGVLEALPMLLGGGQGGGEVRKMEHRHEQHKETSYLPPFLESLYDYWEHFKTSELGQTLWQNSGLGATASLFTDKDGHFEMDKIFGSLENASFRRRWIKSLSSFVAEWVAHLSDPTTQARYLATMQFVGNGFLKTQGYHKAALFDPARPADSLSQLVNAVFQRQFGLKVNSATYIKPAVSYIQEVFKIGQSKGLSLTKMNSQEIESKLAETLNGEVIEPMLKVWRAYRYAIRNPKCDRYVICAVNQDHPSPDKGAGIRPGIIKLASITASWFLSSNNQTPFWKLYTAATEEYKCQTKYPVDCRGYHEEDIRATTEYSHSEL